MIKHINDIESKSITHPSSENASMKALIGKEEGWDDYVMRVVEVKKGGFTPKHQHPWPHINYVLEGEGEVFIDGEIHPVNAGSFAYIKADALHQFTNRGKKDFRFICIVPKEGHQ